MTRYSDKDLLALEQHIALNGTPKGFIPAPKKKRNYEESRNQRAVVKWWQYACRGFGQRPQALMAFPNAAKRDPVAASILKAEGLQPGAPDLFCFVVRPPYAGLACEMKTATGRLSPEQIEVHSVLSANGYCVRVCRSFDEAKDAIERYLTGRSL